MTPDAFERRRLRMNTSLDELLPDQDSTTAGASAPDVLGNQVVREVLSGSGLGALSPILAAELVLQQSGVGEGALGRDSNNIMQGYLQSGVDQVNDLLAGLPDEARSLITESMPYMNMPNEWIARDPSHGTAPQQTRGISTDPAAPAIEGAPVPEVSPFALPGQGDLGALFEQLARMPDAELDKVLLDTGRSFVRALGESGLHELFAEPMANLPAMTGEEEDPAELMRTLEAQQGTPAPVAPTPTPASATPGAPPAEVTAEKPPAEATAEKPPAEAAAEKPPAPVAADKPPAQGTPAEGGAAPTAEGTAEGQGTTPEGQGTAPPGAEAVPAGATAPPTAPPAAPAAPPTAPPPAAALAAPQQSAPAAPVAPAAPQIAPAQPSVAPAPQSNIPPQSAPSTPAAPAPQSAPQAAQPPIATPPTARGIDAAEAPQQHVINMEGNVEVPPELRNGAGAQPPAHDCNAAGEQVQSQVGEGAVPQNEQQNTVTAPGGIPGASGDAVQQTGVNPGAIGGVTHTPNGGTTASGATPSGGSAPGPEVQTGLNPAVNQQMPAAAPHTPEGISPPSDTPQMGPVDGGAGGGGGGSLPQATIPGANYSGGSESLPSPQAPQVPDVASQGASQADQQMRQDAQQMSTVQPAVDGQIASEAAPQQAQGEQSIWDQITAFFSGLFSSEAQANQVPSDAASQRATAEQSTAQLVASAQQQQQAQQAAAAGMPVPAELSQRQSYMQPITAAEAQSVAAWSGPPQTQTPTGAQTAMQQAQTNVAAMQGQAVQPNLAGTVGATQLPPHNLEVMQYQDIVDPSMTEFDPSVIPSPPAYTGGGGGGGDAMGQIQADVDGQISGQVTGQLQQITSEQTSRAQQSMQQSSSETEACFQGTVDRATDAIAQYESADVAGTVAPYDAQANAAFQGAQSEAQAAQAQMGTDFAGQTAQYDSTVAGATGTFQGAVTTAQQTQSAALQAAGQTYDQSVSAADQQMRQQQNAALGTYQGTAQSAVQGAQQTFAQENAAAQTAITGHQSQFNSQYQAHRSSADAVGQQAQSQLQGQFSQQMSTLQSQTGSQIAATQGQIDQQISTGNAEVRRELQAGQTQAQSHMNQGLAQAEAERNTAQNEADRQRREAEAKQDDRNFLQRAGDAIVDFVKSALDWIKARFEEAKNAILGFLEAARDLALKALAAARDLALAVLDRVRGLIKGLISMLADVLRAFVSAFARFFEALIRYFVEWILRQLQAITALINTLIEAFQQLVNLVVQGLIAAVALIDADLAAKLQSAADVFLDAFNSACDNAQTAIQNASSQLQSTIQSAGDALIAGIQSAEQMFLTAIDTAEAALHQGVDMVYQAAVDKVNEIYETAVNTVNTLYEAARSAVVFLIDGLYSIIETVALEYAKHWAEVLNALGTAMSWVQENIVGPLLTFLADPWTGLRKMWVSFWNSPWRDVLLGVALSALATVVVVATGGLGLVAIIAITAAVTGAAAAATYGLGEMAARTANVSLLQEGHQTWSGASMVDPKSGQMVPDPRDPKNSWYLDTMGSISSNPDGSMSYRDKDGNLVTVTADQLQNDPSAVIAMMDQGLARDESGRLTGESTADSLRGSAALAADKGIEWAVNGAVTAATMGMGNKLTALAQAGRMSQVAATSTRVLGSAAISSAGELVSAPLSDAVGEMVADGRSFNDAMGMAWQHKDVGDVARAFFTSMAVNATGDMLGGSSGYLYNPAAGKGSLVRGTLADATTGVMTSTSGMVIQNASEAFFGDVKLDEHGNPISRWDTFVNRTFSQDALDQIIQGTVQNALSARGDQWATRTGERIRPQVTSVFGSRGNTAVDRALADIPGAGPTIPARRTDDPPSGVVRPTDSAVDTPPVVQPQTDTPNVRPQDTPPVTDPLPVTQRPVQTSNDPLPVNGNAAALPGSSFTGDRSSQPVHQDTVHQGLSDLGPAVGLTRDQINVSRDRDGTPVATLALKGPDGQDLSVPVRIETLDPSANSERFAGPDGVAAAQYVRNKDGTYTVYVSDRIHPADVQRALAHEMAEIRFLEQRGLTENSSQPGALRPDAPEGAQLTAHDMGRLGEISALASELDRKPGHTERRAEVQRELDLLLQTTGLDGSDGSRARLDIIRQQVAEGNLPPAVLRLVEARVTPRPRTDPDIAASDFPQPNLARKDPVDPSTDLPKTGNYQEQQAQIARQRSAELSEKLANATTPEQRRAALEEAYHAVRQDLIAIAGSDPNKLAKMDQLIPANDPNNDPFGLMASALTPEGSYAQQQRERTGDQIRDRFDTASDPNNTSSRLSEDGNVLQNIVRLPDGTLIEGNRILRGAEADAIDAQKGGRYGFADGAEKFVTQTGTPENMQRLHDAGIETLASLTDPQSRGAADSPERFADAAYYLYQGLLYNRGGDGNIRTFLAAAGKDIFGQGFQFPQDIDIRAFAHSQDDFRAFMADALRAQGIGGDNSGQGGPTPRPGDQGPNMGLTDPVTVNLGGDDLAAPVRRNIDENLSLLRDPNQITPPAAPVDFNVTQQTRSVVRDQNLDATVGRSALGAVAGGDGIFRVLNPDGVKLHTDSEHPHTTIQQQYDLIDATRGLMLRGMSESDVRALADRAAADVAARGDLTPEQRALAATDRFLQLAAENKTAREIPPPEGVTPEQMRTVLDRVGRLRYLEGLDAGQAKRPHDTSPEAYQADVRRLLESGPVDQVLASLDGRTNDLIDGLIARQHPKGRELSAISEAPLGTPRPAALDIDAQALSRDHENYQKLDELRRRLESGEQSAIGGSDYPLQRFPEEVLSAAARGEVHTLVYDGSLENAQAYIQAKYGNGQEGRTMGLQGLDGSGPRSLVVFPDGSKFLVVAGTGESRQLHNAGGLLLYTDAQGRRIPSDKLELASDGVDIAPVLRGDIERAITQPKADPPPGVDPATVPTQLVVIQNPGHLKEALGDRLVQWNDPSPDSRIPFVTAYVRDASGNVTRIIVPKVGGNGLYGDSAGKFVGAFFDANIGPRNGDVIFNGTAGGFSNTAEHPDFHAQGLRGLGEVKPGGVIMPQSSIKQAGNESIPMETLLGRLGSDGIPASLRQAMDDAEVSLTDHHVAVKAPAVETYQMIDDLISQGHASIDVEGASIMSAIAAARERGHDATFTPVYTHSDDPRSSAHDRYDSLAMMGPFFEGAKFNAPMFRVITELMDVSASRRTGGEGSGTPPVSGQAAVLPGSSFTGDRSTTPFRPHDVGTSLRNLREGMGLSRSEFTFRQSEDGSQQAKLSIPMADGQRRDVSVRVETVPADHGALAGEHGTAAAAYRRNDDGTYTVFLSAGTDASQITRALAHEMAEIRFLERTGETDGASEGGAMQPGSAVDARMTAHDAGRMAEIALLAAQLQRMKPPEGQQGSPRYQETLAEMGVLLQQTGLSDINSSSRERMRILRAEAEAGNLPPSVLKHIEEHLGPQLAVDLGDTQRRVGDLSKALFTGVDYSDADSILKAVRGLDEHQARAFKDVLSEQFGLDMPALQRQLKGRIGPADYAEVMAHLSGDPYQGSIAALRNTLRDKSLKQEGAELDPDIAKQGPGWRRLVWDIGGAVSAGFRRMSRDYTGAIDVLATMKPEDRAKLLRDESDLVKRLGENIPEDGPLRRQWEALTTPPSKPLDQWALRSRAEYLLAHVEQQLQVDGGLMGRFRKNQEGAVATLDLLRQDPELYGAVSAALKRRNPRGDPKSELEQIFASSLRKEGARGDEMLEVVRNKIAQASLGHQNRDLVLALRDAGLPIVDGSQLSELAALGQDPEGHKRLVQAIGGPRVDDLMRFARQRRQLDHEETAHRALAAVKGQRFDELMTVLTDKTGSLLDEQLARTDLSDKDRRLAQFRQDAWRKDRDALMATIEQASGKPFADLVADELHTTSNRAGNTLSRWFGAGDSVRFRETVLPTLVRDGQLPPHDQLYLGMVGLGADASLASSALKGKSPDQIRQIAEEFRSAHGDKYRSLLKKHSGPDDAVGFLRAVLGKELSGRGEFDALRMMRGDPSTIYDPKNKELSPEQRQTAATERWELERTLLDESYGYETKRTGAYEWALNLQREQGQLHTVDRLDQRHLQIAVYLEQNASLLKKGDPAAWESLRLLRESYDAAAAHNDSFRSQFAKKAPRMAGTIATIGASAALPLVGMGLPLAARALISSGQFAATELMDHTRSHNKTIADGTATAFGLGLSTVLPAELRDEFHERVLGMTSQSLSRRAVESAYDWRNSRRGTELQRAMFSDTLKSLLSGGITEGSRNASSLFDGDPKQIEPLEGAFKQASERPFRSADAAGKTAVDQAVSRATNTRGDAQGPKAEKGDAKPVGTGDLLEGPVPQLRGRNRKKKRRNDS